MSASLPTTPGDPISQSNVADADGGLSSNGNYSSPTDTTFGGSSTFEEGSMTGSGNSPFLYFLMLLWLVWVLLVGVWVPLLVVRNRRKSQEQEASNIPDESNDTNERNHKYQRYKESGSQTTMTLLFLFAAAIGLGLSIYANLSCDFVQVDPSLTLTWKFPSEEDYYRIMNEGGDNVVDTGDTLRLEYYTIGLWALGLSSSKSDFLGDGDSFSISEAEGFGIGWQFQVARVASVVASVLGGLSFLFLIAACCYPSQRGYFRYLTLPFLMATISQSLTLFLLDTAYCTSLTGCEMGLGSLASITASLYWLFGAVVSLMQFPLIESTIAPFPSEEASSQLSNEP